MRLMPDGSEREVVVGIEAVRRMVIVTGDCTLAVRQVASERSRRRRQTTWLLLMMYMFDE